MHKCKKLSTLNRPAFDKSGTKWIVVHYKYDSDHCHAHWMFFQKKQADEPQNFE